MTETDTWRGKRRGTSGTGRAEEHRLPRLGGDEMRRNELRHVHYHSSLAPRRAVTGPTIAVGLPNAEPVAKLMVSAALLLNRL